MIPEYKPPPDIKIIRQTVVAKSRRLSARWTFNDPYAVEEIFRPPARESDREVKHLQPNEETNIIATQGLDIEEELAQLLQQEILNEMNGKSDPKEPQ